MLNREMRIIGRPGAEAAGVGLMDVSRFIPGRDAIHCRTAEDPYRIAWEAAAHLSIPDAVDEVVQRCGITIEQASLLVFCEVRESQPVLPRP